MNENCHTKNMAVFFRVFMINVKHICIELTLLIFKIRFDIICKEDGIKLVTKNKTYFLNLKSKRNRRVKNKQINIPTPQGKLMTIKKSFFYLSVYVNKWFLISKNIESIFIIIFDLFNNSILNNSKEKLKNLSKNDFIFNLQFMVILHIKRIIIYLIKILKTSKIRRTNYGSNV